MNKHDMEECLKRAAECIRLEAANDPEMKIYLMKTRLILASRRGGGV
jgi:hypothetical protein